MSSFTKVDSSSAYLSYLFIGFQLNNSAFKPVGFLNPSLLCQYRSSHLIKLFHETPSSSNWTILSNTSLPFQCLLFSIKLFLFNQTLPFCTLPFPGRSRHFCRRFLVPFHRGFVFSTSLVGQISKPQPQRLPNPIPYWRPRSAIGWNIFRVKEDDVRPESRGKAQDNKKKRQAKAKAKGESRPKARTEQSKNVITEVPDAPLLPAQMQMLSEPKGPTIYPMSCPQGSWRTWKSKDHESELCSHSWWAKRESNRVVRFFAAEFFCGKRLTAKQLRPKSEKQ